MVGNIVVRNYEQQDWSQIEEIHDAARKIELHYAGLDEAFVPLKQAAVNEGLFDYTVCVALLNDKVLGFAAYSENEIAWLYVDPKSMRQGIGKRLILHVIKNMVHRPIELEVLVGNNPAVSLYKSMGFEITETSSGVMPGNESFKVTVHCMQHQ